jgi:ABC-type nitrate/sulfonate/bicarbonate transport system substrate-binding protein
VAEYRPLINVSLSAASIMRRAREVTMTIHEPRSRREVMRTLGTGAFGCLSISISAHALGLPAAAAESVPKIVLGKLPLNAMVTTYLGPVDFFKDEGLSVEILPGQAGPAINQAIAAGSVVVGDTGLAPAMVAMTRGIPILAPHLGAFVSPVRPFERILVKADSPIRTLDDLKGKKLAILGRGTIPELILGALAKKSNIRKEDIELVVLPPPNQPAALQQGQVDAIFATPPTDSVAEQQYKARSIGNGTDIVPYLGLAGLVVRRDFAESYPDATKRLYKAAIKIARWTRDNEAAARSVAAKNLGLPDELAAHGRLPLLSRNGLQVMPSLWHVYEMMVAAKTIDAHPDPKRLFNDAVIEPAKRYILPALEDLGMQSDEQIDAMLTGDYPLLPNPIASYYSDWEKRILKI